MPSKTKSKFPEMTVRKLATTRILGLSGMARPENSDEHFIVVQMEGFPKPSSTEKVMALSVELLWDYAGLQRQLFQETGRLLYHPAIEAIESEIRQDYVWKKAINEFIATGKAPKILTQTADLIKTEDVCESAKMEHQKPGRKIKR